MLDKKNDILLDGALLIDVHLQYAPEPKILHVPSSPLAKNMLALLEKGEDADVSFKVGNTTIKAHKLILKANARILFDFCDGNDGSPIPLPNNITPGTFNTILRYIYAGEGPSGEASVSWDDAENIIDAADRFGLVGLKVAWETRLVESLVIDGDNVAECLLFADAKTCPLLKEYAISYINSRAADLSEAFELLNDSPKLMQELVLATSSSTTSDARFSATGRNMPVNELRTTLGMKGLDVDGSKEMLISRLQESIKKKQRTR